MLGAKLVIIVVDNRGFGCINRLQQACGGAPFNNLLADARSAGAAPDIDFAAHAQSLGALAERVSGIAELEGALARARAAARTSFIVIETDPALSTAEGGAWWDVPVAAVSTRAAVSEARSAYETAIAARRGGVKP